ncbi:MAG TPA: tetratricopeptide repeat protein, partial [Chloroflexota bacterium]|nr:tetratricopeptide repeat protein [Chloroflexota bacterium]
TNGHVASMFAMAALSAIDAKEYERAIAVEGRAPAEYVSADLLYHAGLGWWQLGHAGEARARFVRALSDPSLRDHNAHDRSTSTWRPLIALAAIDAEEEDYAGAYEHARQALEFAPTRPDGLFLKARAAYALGRVSEACELCLMLLRGERDEGFKPKGRQLLLTIAGDLDDAELILEALSGDLEGVGAADALCLEARAHARLGNLQRQQELLIRACSEYPADAGARLALAEALEEQGLADDAIGVLAGAMDHPPVPAAVFQRLAMLLAKQGRLEDAANALELAGRSLEQPEAVAS